MKSSKKSESIRPQNSVAAVFRKIAAMMILSPRLAPVLRLLGAAAVLLCADSTLFADTPYDLLIRNGTIVDGSGNPWFRGDVAVRGERIVAVGRVPPGTAKREIDAKGLVVAPGFIDVHSHSDDLLLEDGHAQSKIRQGVTTEILGEGNSAGPSRGQLKPRAFRAPRLTLQWDTLGGYFDAIDKAGVSVNVASYVGLSTVWECV